MGEPKDTNEGPGARPSTTTEPGRGRRLGHWHPGGQWPECGIGNRRRGETLPRQVRPTHRHGLGLVKFGAIYGYSEYLDTATATGDADRNINAGTIGGSSRDTRPAIVACLALVGFTHLGQASLKTHLRGRPGWLSGGLLVLHPRLSCPQRSLPLRPYCLTANSSLQPPKSRPLTTSFLLFRCRKR